MRHFALYTAYGTTAMQVSETAVRIRGTVYDLQRPVTVGLVKALILKLQETV